MSRTFRSTHQPQRSVHDNSGVSTYRADISRSLPLCSVHLGLNPDKPLRNLTEGSATGDGDALAEHAQSPYRERLWTVVLFALVACLGSTLCGAVGGYTTNTISDLESNPGKFGVDIRDFERGTFSSLGALGMAFGAPCAWPFSVLLGRKPTLIIGGAIGVASWLIITYADFLPSSQGVVAMLSVGRFATGITGGWLLYIVSIYVVEISTPKTRGALGSSNQLFLTTGIFISQGLGAVLPFDIVALIITGNAACFVALLLVIPESPRWLYRRGKEEEGRKTLQFLRGPKATINKEVQGIKQVVKNSGKTTIFQQILEFRHREAYHPFLLCVILVFFAQMTGVTPLLFYSTQIFQQASVPKPELFSTFLVSGIQFFTTFASILLMIPFGRKTLLVASSVGMFIMMATLGVYFLIHDDICHGCLGLNCTDSAGDIHLNNSPPCSLSGLSSLAVVSLSSFVIAYSVGWGPIPWTMLSALLPLRNRALAASMATFLNWILGFIILQAFPKYSNAITLEVACWNFSALIVIGALFVVIFLPETKRQSLEEIEEAFKKGQIFFLPWNCTNFRKRKKMQVLV